MIKLFKTLFSITSLFPFKSIYNGGSILLTSSWILFTYTVFSGAVRKWAFGPGQASNTLFLVQMLMPFIFFLCIVSFSKAPSRFRTPLFFFIFLGYLILAALNPKNHTIYHGLFGLLIYLGFWVSLIGYYLKRHFFEVEKLTGFFILILIIEVVLASVQYSLPPEHILNIVGDGKPIDALVGSSVRVSGTFNYIGGFQVLVTFYGFLIWFMLVVEVPFILSAFVFLLSVYAALMSGSRGSIIMFLFVSLFAFIYTGALFRKFFYEVITAAVVLITLLFFFGDNFIKSFDQAYDNFSDRVEWGQESGESETRVASLYEEVVNFKGKYPIYGIGLGSTYQGANIIYGQSIYAKEYGYYEVEAGRIILEGGYILFFLRIIALFVFLSYSYIPRVGKFVIFIFFLGSVVVFNTYQSIFFFFGLMMVDRAYFLTKKTDVVKPR